MADDAIRIQKVEDELERDDEIQHGIDDNPDEDPAKGAALGGVGGAILGAVAGAPTGPAGMAVGAIAGGMAGAVASGAAVAVVDNVDNDNTLTGIGDTPAASEEEGLEEAEIDPTARAIFTDKTPGEARDSTEAAVIDTESTQTRDGGYRKMY